MRDGEQNLGERLERMERVSAELDEQLGAGEALLARLTRIAGAARPAAAPPAVPDAKAVAAAAQAFAERTRARLDGLAA